MRELRIVTLSLLLLVGLLSAPSSAADRDRSPGRSPAALVVEPVRFGWIGEAVFEAEQDDEGPAMPFSPLLEWLEEDPLTRPDIVVEGGALARLQWQADSPAFAGDAVGSLTALYDSTLPAGLFGFPLPASLSAADSFVAAAAFVIEADGFAADPDGFFQLSWGLWNSAATGLNRTGNLQSFAADTFELIELDYFPNITFFGGPFLSPGIFGEALAPGADAFSNFVTLFDLEATLPRGTPLLSVIEHRAADELVTFQVYRLLSADSAVPINGAAGFVALDGLGSRNYDVDTVGLTLWNDGFGGPTPALVATVRFHTFAVLPGSLAGAEAVFGPFGGGDDDDDDEQD